MATVTEQAISVLEDTAILLRKAQINLKKCPKERFTKGYIESRIKNIEEYWSTFKKAHESLVKNTTREQRGTLSYFVNEEFYLSEDLYLCLIGDLKDMLASKIQAHDMEVKSTNSSYEVMGQSQVRLPTIQLPIFTGNYEEWPTYQDMFQSLVHQNTSLTPVQKLHYLKTTVAGEAATLLKHIQVTDANYMQAWETLSHRYGNRRLIVNALLRRLITQRKCITQSSQQLKSLLDTSTECLNSLKNMKICIDSWDPIIIFLVVQKLDPESRREWEQHAFNDNSDEMPTWDNLKRFLELKFRTLEMSISTSSPRERTNERNNKERAFHVTTENKISCCVKCKEDHTLSHCSEFIKMKPSDRGIYVKNSKICFNCLTPGHTSMKCRVPQSCRICNRRHHSLLHLPYRISKPIEEPKQPTEHVEEVMVNSMMASHHHNEQRVALLATAVVVVQSEEGHTTILKALVDKGSQACFISEKAAQILKLRRYPTSKIVTGMESMKVAIKQVVNIQVKSRWESEFNLPVQAYIMSRSLTTHIPIAERRIAYNLWPHLSGLNLADPDYCTSGTIDLLLGVKEYATMLQEGLIKGPPGTPCAQNTSLGWIIFGEVNLDTDTHENAALVMHQQLETDTEEINMHEMLKKLWEIDTNTSRKLSQEEQQFEEHYEKTHSRDNTGRYVVKLPFKNEQHKSTEGDTKTIATNRLLQLERRFRHDVHLKEEYIKVIEEYKKLKHMEEIPKQEINKKSVYLPHHAVRREDKETTKTRVVFDASCKSSNGVSLNDELLLGPQLQEDLRYLVMRWRMHAVCFIADIHKMYRMIWMDGTDCDYQRILWRNDPAEEIKEYRLLTVTFGTASAPCLAIRTLLQLAKDEGHKYPEAAKVLKEDFYVDDLMSGCDRSSDAIQISKDLKELLSLGGFELKKWASNNVEFMKSIAPCERSANTRLDINVDGKIKTLGVLWNLESDQIEYSLPVCSLLSNNITKRTILSAIQKLFDPLGWAAPCLILAKILIQRLWLEQLSWDEEITSPLRDEWLTIRDDLSNINKIKINRWLGTTSTEKECIQIHGFCDASMKAYAAVVYCRVERTDGNIHTALIAAKTRVAPLKTISLPRLELCGAVLLAQLMKQVSIAMRVPVTKMHAWTDSTIVLAWLSGESNKWKPFVANRTVEILGNLSRSQWHHVQSQDNPADIGSRGMLLSELQNNQLWWKGPEWLSMKDINIIELSHFNTDLEKRKIQSYLNVEEKIDTGNTLFNFEEYSSLLELQKTIVYCIRFLNYKKLEKSGKTIQRALTTEELEKALKICIRYSQKESFEEEINSIKLKAEVKSKSNLKSINPYLDEENILRVGGRLRNANLSENNKHPIILDNKNKFTYLVVAEAHTKTLHGGVELMLSYLRSKYWVIKARSLVKKHIHRCMVCAKQRSIAKTQMMGDLPKARVTPSRPFSHAGVDFAGPIQILNSKGRGAKTTKAYIAIFVCMSTKAIHLELVGDLSSAAFIGAFKRFCSRRGRCSHLWSDQGRNFVGANKELEKAWKDACLDFTGEIAESVAKDGTQWHFIPAYSPNFGGLWEAGVKSLKHHLKRILTTNLTFEELTTILCQIEACLNSRPLCPVDECDDNIQPLTPGHFLTGEPPIVVPEPSLQHVKVSNLSRWQHTQKLLNDLWKRWREDYLLRLQKRPKWLKPQKEMSVGDIVHIKIDNLPPGKWMLGRIVEKHPGPDGLTRVYSVKSGDTITKRSVTKLCLLPVNDSDCE